VNTVTLCTTLKLDILARVSFYLSYKRPRFSLLKKDNQSVILKRQAEYVIWPS